MRRAESYMTENAGTAISIPDVAAAPGVRVRSLQEVFRQWRNTTPNEFLRQTRLRLVRELVQVSSLRSARRRSSLRLAAPLYFGPLCNFLNRPLNRAMLDDLIPWGRALRAVRVQRAEREEL